MAEHGRTATAGKRMIGALALGVLCTAATGLAAPASADTSSYLEALAPRYTSMSSSQLMSAGHSVCSATGSGMPASDIVATLVKNYDISVSAAYEVTVAAINHLGC